jgi:hypothetical protein
VLAAAGEWNKRKKRATRMYDAADILHDSFTADTHSGKGWWFAKRSAAISSTVVAQQN